LNDKRGEEADVLLIAEAAGLQKALEAFRDDVFSAAKAAADARKAFAAPEEAAVEPWPPMRTGERP
jgi:hypothetical protein